MWEIGEEVKTTMKKEAKTNSNKNPKLLCFRICRVLCPGYRKSPGYFLQKQHFYILWWECGHFSSFGWTFLTIEKVYQGLFSFLQFFYSGIPCSCRGQCTSWKVSLTREIQMLHLELSSCRTILATLRRAEAFCSPIICFLWGSW